MKSSARAIGANIRKIRTERNMTQDVLAESLYVTRQTVSNYETGRSSPDLDTLLRIAEILGTDISTLIYGQPDPESPKAANRDLITSAIVFAALLIVTPIGLHFLKRLAYSSFLLQPLQIFRFTMVPGLMLSGGWLLIALFRRFSGLKALRMEALKPGRIILFSLLALNAAVILPFLIWNVYDFIVSLCASSVSTGFPSVPVYDQLFYFFYHLVYRFPYFYCLVGLALHMFQKPDLPSE